MTTSTFKAISLEGLQRTPPEFLMHQGANATTDEIKPPAPWFRFENKAAADGSSSDTTEIYIYDEIGGWFGMTAVDFIDQLKAVDTAKIDLHLNSPGGEVFDGVAIYNSLVNHKAEVTVYVDGLAASAASFIAQSGDKVIMQKASTMMIHDASGLAWGNARDMVDTANILNKISDNIASIYADRTGGSQKEWRALMQEEVWYTAKEAVDAGLADSVSSKRVSAPAENKFNLAIFNFAHTSREDAPSPAEIQRKVQSNMGKRTVTNDTTGSEGAAAEGAATEEETAAAEAAAATAEAAAAAAAEVAATEAAAAETAATEAAAAAATEASARSGMMILNGVSAPVDMVAVQNHINSLEQFRKETLEAGRSKFVKDLAEDSKIGAPQIASLDVFAQGLSNEQYEAWTKTWDVAVSLPLFGNHAAGTTNHSGDNSTEAVKTDRIEVLKGIVKQHSMAKMDASQILKTPSYNELIKLDPTFTL